MKRLKSNRKLIFLPTGILLLLFLYGNMLLAQENVLTVGIQYKPIVKTRFFGMEPISLQHTDSLSGVLAQKLGHTFGVVIRKGLNRRFSIETGINWIRRNYNMNLYDSFDGKGGKLDFGIVSYEIPIQLLVYIRLSERLYMNVSTGVSINKFASDVASSSLGLEVSEETTIRNSFFQLSLLANLGMEYRTQKSGYFYFGTSLHKPFKDIARTSITYKENGISTTFDQFLNGNFVTMDFRYFFYEKPVEK